MEMENLVAEVEAVLVAQTDHRELVQELLNNYNMGFITTTELSEQIVSASLDYKNAVSKYDLTQIYTCITYKNLLECGSR